MSRPWRVSWRPDGSFDLIGPAYSRELLEREPWRYVALGVGGVWISFQLIGLGVQEALSFTRAASTGDVGDAVFLVVLNAALIGLVILVGLLFAKGSTVVTADAAALTTSLGVGSGRMIVQRVPWRKVRSIEVDFGPPCCSLVWRSWLGPTRFGFGLDPATAQWAFESLQRFRQLAVAPVPPVGSQR